MGEGEERGPLTAEGVATELRELERRADLAFWERVTTQALTELADIKIALRLYALGGIKAHPNQLRQRARVLEEQLEVLARIRLELEDGPLPRPSPLEVPSLVIPEG